MLESIGPLQINLSGASPGNLTMPPLQIGPYRIVRPLSEGGMGVVYEAIQAHIERRVALKILLPQHATNHETLQRFFNEARAVNLIEHPSIVQISDYGQEPDGTAYLVMEYLRGEPLSDRLDRTHGAGNRLPLENILQIAAQIAGALAAAHSKSVIHRDLKPSNVMLVKDAAFPTGERVKILDFGIAKLLHSQSRGTAPNAVVGTPQYMSPEQCRGAGSVDEKTDVYALGLILFEMIAGRPPFIADGPIEYIGQHAFREPPALQSFAPSISASLAAFVHSLLIKDKTLRPPMHEAEAELGRQITKLSTPALPVPGLVAEERDDETQRYLPPPSALPGVPLSIPPTAPLIIPPGALSSVPPSAPLSIPPTAPLIIPPSAPPSTAPAAPETTVNPVVRVRRLARRQRKPLVIGAVALGVLTIVVVGWGVSALRSPSRVPPAVAPAPPSPGASPQPKPLPEASATDPAPAPSASGAKSPSTLAAAPPARPLINPNDVLQRAQTAFDKGEYGRAITLASSVKLLSPKRAWRLIGSAACNSKDLNQANNAFRHLDPPGQKYLSIVCAKLGIQIVNGQLRFLAGTK